MVMDSMYSFPDIVLAMAVSIALGPGIYNAAAAIAVVYVPTYFRMVRGQALSIREQNYVTAAKMMGARAYDIMIRYVLPTLVPVVVTVFTLNVTDAILTEAALSYLGLGVVPPTPDWGSDLRSGQIYLLSGRWWLVNHTRAHDNGTCNRFQPTWRRTKRYPQPPHLEKIVSNEFYCVSIN